MKRRWVMRILLCVILGAVTTVAVAWGCTWWWASSSSIAEGELDRSILKIWEESLPQQYSHLRPGALFSYTRLGVDDQTLQDEMSLDGPWLSLNVVHAGFPARALRFRYWSRLLSGDVDGHFDFDGALWYAATDPATDVALRARALPLRPIWPGFLIDTLFYAAIWLGLFFGFTSTKRLIRTKRGRCPHCAYDLRGEPGRGCPECGWNRNDGAADRASN